MSYLSKTLQWQRNQSQHPYGEQMEDLITLDDRLRMVATDPAALRTALDELRLADDLHSRRKLGVGLIVLGNYSEAVVVLDGVVREALSTADRRAEVAARLNLGDAFRYHGDLRAALTEYQRALASARSSVPELLDFALQHLGKYYLDAGNESEATVYLWEALRLRRAKGDQALIDSTMAALNLAVSTGAELSTTN